MVALAAMKRRFEELRCWQMAREYRKAIYAVTRKFPKDEQFGLTNPSLVISVWSDEQSTDKSPAWVIRFGHFSPSGAAVYALVPHQEELLLIDADVLNRLKYFLFVPPLNRGGRADYHP